MIKTTAGLSPLARRVAQERIEHLTQLGVTLSLDVAEGVDKAFVRLAFHGRRTSDRATRMSVISRVVSAGRYYERLDAEGRLYPAPPTPRLVEEGRRPLVGGRVVDVRWPSAWRGLDPSHRRTLDLCRENAICHARWYRHDRPAPALICLHGWGMGYPDIEERSFSAHWLYRRGLDVLMLTLPFHASRAPRGKLRPRFPTIDPVRTNEGFAQAVSDVRGMMRALHARGAPSVGLTGMSLGGFTTGLMATVEPTVAYAIPQIPFPSIAELLLHHVDGSPVADRARARGLEESAFLASLKATTPLERAPVISGERVLILAGERDRVTPMPHAVRLKEHFPGATLLTFPGAHVMQLGRRALMTDVLDFIARSGVTLEEPVGRGLPSPA